MNKLECFACGAEVINIGPKAKRGDSIIPMAWGGAVTIEVTGGFGSKFDCHEYHGVICDQCVEKHLDRLHEVRSVTAGDKTVIYAPRGPINANRPQKPTTRPKQR